MKVLFFLLVIFLLGCNFRDNTHYKITTSHGGRQGFFMTQIHINNHGDVNIICKDTGMEKCPFYFSNTELQTPQSMEAEKTLHIVLDKISKGQMIGNETIHGIKSVWKTDSKFLANAEIELIQ